MSDLGTVTRSDDGGYVLHYERVFDKPPREVWAALTDPAMLTRWLARSDVDLRVGGKFVIYFFDGRETMHGEIRALEPQRLIEYSWEEDETPLSSVRWTLTPEGDGCRLTLTHTLPSAASPALVIELGGGWHAILGYLGTHLQDQTPVFDRETVRAGNTLWQVVSSSGDALMTDGSVTRVKDGGYILHYERNIDQPPAKIWAALTDPAIAKNWLGTVEADLRIGGRYVIHFHDNKVVMTGVIRALEPEKLIEYTWLENYGMPQSAVRWTITAQKSGCKLTLTHTFPPGCKPEEIVSFGEGWHSFLDALRIAAAGGDGREIAYCDGRTTGLTARYTRLVETAPQLTIDGTLHETQRGEPFVHFERLLDQPTTKVWAALVEPAVLANWLGEVEVEPRVGGKYVVRTPFAMNGAITVFEPQKVLEYSWVEDIGLPPSHVRWELAPSQAGCRLTLTHTFPKGLRRADLVPFLGGWEAFLDAVADGANGTKVPNIPYEPYDVQYRAKYLEDTP